MESIGNSWQKYSMWMNQSVKRWSWSLFDGLKLDLVIVFNGRWRKFNDGNVCWLKIIKTFKNSIHTIDVTFQKYFRPYGNIYEGKLYKSYNQKIYGNKFEVSVLPNGMRIMDTNYYFSLKSELTIFQEHRYISGN